MKKIMLFVLVSIMIFSFAACNKQVTEVPPQNEVGSTSDGEAQTGENNVVDPQPSEEKVKVTLYFMNQEYITTGNEKLDKVIAVEREVSVGEKPLEEVILQELQKAPQDEKLSTALNSIKILSVETAGDTAFVNISGEKLSGGSLQEMSILNQIVLSLTELPEIKKVQLLVDGSKRETLMGHIYIQEPLTRNGM